ncbi:uncharacterized protein NEMAJ01_0603 [Nematocida major]|uniref:uncharacterized protein n=1 Tax=Nematocida major TaxID=1912982 RepID=UPI0020076A79|nr:uncharacterized protein NEMAJ01_0603 [Nematocida major]KAH9385707.1 hypothetical protein NEMAJ01_0603 [Nematocida major]
MKNIVLDGVDLKFKNDSLGEELDKLEITDFSVITDYFMLSMLLFRVFKMHTIVEAPEKWPKKERVCIERGIHAGVYIQLLEISKTAAGCVNELFKPVYGKKQYKNWMLFVNSKRKKDPEETIGKSMARIYSKEAEKVQCMYDYCGVVKLVQETQRITDLVFQSMVSCKISLEKAKKKAALVPAGRLNAGVRMAEKIKRIEHERGILCRKVALLESYKKGLFMAKCLLWNKSKNFEKTIKELREEHIEYGLAVIENTKVLQEISSTACRGVASCRVIYSVECQRDQKCMAVSKTSSGISIFLCGKCLAKAVHEKHSSIFPVVGENTIQAQFEPFKERVYRLEDQMYITCAVVIENTLKNDFSTTFGTFLKSLNASKFPEEMEDDIFKFVMCGGRKRLLIECAARTAFEHLPALAMAAQKAEMHHPNSQVAALNFMRKDAIEQDIPICVIRMLIFYRRVFTASKILHPFSRNCAVIIDRKYPASRIKCFHGKNLRIPAKNYLILEPVAILETLRKGLCIPSMCNSDENALKFSYLVNWDVFTNRKSGQESVQITRPLQQLPEEGPASEKMEYGETVEFCVNVFAYGLSPHEKDQEKARRLFRKKQSRIDPRILEVLSSKEKSPISGVEKDGEDGGVDLKRVLFKLPMHLNGRALLSMASAKLSIFIDGQLVEDSAIPSDEGLPSEGGSGEVFPRALGDGGAEKRPCEEVQEHCTPQKARKV